MSLTAIPVGARTSRASAVICIAAEAVSDPSVAQNADIAAKKDLSPDDRDVQRLRCGQPVASGFVPASFYEPAGPGAFVATSATAGPWSPDAQHGGPPSALAAREIELHEAQEHMRLARVAVDILRPVPLGLLTLRTRTLRPGKRIALIETVMESAGQEVLCARGWRIAMPDAVPVITREVDVPAIPEHSVREAFRGAYPHGYLAQIDWRFVSGTFTEPGPCQAWGRSRIPLLPGEDMTPMCRTLLLADSGSGVSMALDPMTYLSINVDLTVALQRDPVGEWLMLDGLSTMGGTGTGLAETLLWDTQGVCGIGLQTLLVAPR